MLHTGWSSTGCRSCRWHGQMTALEPSSFTSATSILHCTIVWSPVPDQHRHRESGNQDKPHWQIAMQLRYRSSHWIVPWVVSIFVITIQELDCPWFMSSINYIAIKWSLKLTYDVTTQNKSQKWFTVSGQSKQTSKQTYTRTSAMKSR